MGGQVQGCVRRRLRGDPAPDPGPPEGSLGLLPADTELSAINPHGATGVTGPNGQPWPLLDTVRPWGSLSDDEKRLFIRMAEVFAGYVEYTDYQVGRVIDFLEQSASWTTRSSSSCPTTAPAGRADQFGTFNEMRFFNGVPTPPELSLQHIDELGGPKSYNHYNTGWAWAFHTPFPYWKRWAGFEGGIADMCMVAWPARVATQDAVRHQYVHAVDLVPTIYDLIGITPPPTLNGWEGRARSRARASPPHSPTRQPR